MDHYRLFIEGEFVEAEGGRTFPSIDPGTGAPIATVAQAGKADAEAAIAAARRAFDKGEWSRMTPAARAEKLYDFADQIAQLGPRLGLVESMDSGQVIRLARFWGMAGSSLFRNLAHYAATKFPWQEEIPYAGNLSPGRDYLLREPVGVCVGIIPWNFPASMAFWKIAQAITMGNTVVLKPASATPLSALIIAEAALAAGIPKGVINVVTGPAGIASAVLLRGAVPVTGADAMRAARVRHAIATRSADRFDPAAASARLARVPDDRLAIGPGNLAAAFDVGRGEDGVDLLDPAGSLRLAPGDGRPFVILATRRVGVAYAGPGWADRPWRFVIGQT